MAVPVVAKVAVAVVKDKNLRKIVVGIILGVLIIIVAPIAILLGVIDAGQQIDWSDPAMQQSVVDNMTDEQKAELQAVEDTMNAIEAAMTAAGYGGMAREAQVIYITTLYDPAQSDPALVDTLVGCFNGGPDDAELIRRVNAAFGVNIVVDEFQKIMSVVKNTFLDVSGFTDPTTKNAADLVEWAHMALDAHWGYVWGTYGQVLTSARLATLVERYPDEVGGKETYIRDNWLNGRTSDCNGLIKSYGWFDPDTGEVEFGANGVPDLSANGLHDAATVKGPMSTMPDIPGLAVWHDGHIGIYVGNGEVIEAMSTVAGVKMTYLPSARWTAWLEVPWIDYSAVQSPSP